MIKNSTLKKAKRFSAGIIAAVVMLTTAQLPSATKVNAASAAVILSHTEKTLNIGDKITLKAKIAKKSLKAKKVVWKSSKANIASVTQKGVVTAKKKGSAKITATLKGTNHKSICKIKVTNKMKTENINFTVATKVRLAGDTDKTWKKSVDAKIGDKVEFQIVYKNTSDARQENVIVDDQLPSNLRYVPGSTWLANGNNPTGLTMNEDDVVKTGLLIGHYNPGANAIIRFYAEVVDDDFTCGKFILRNWGRASTAGKVIQDSADVNVQLAYCPDPEQPNPDVPVNPDKPTDVPTDNKNPTTPSELPKTVPVAIAGSVIAAGSIVTN